MNRPNSASVRVKPRLAWAYGGWWRKRGGAASGSFRGSPWTSAARVDRGWKMGGLLGGTEAKFIKLRTIERGGRNIAAVSLRQPPRKSVDVRGICGRKMEDGKLRGKQRKNVLNVRNQGGWAKYRFRQLPSASADVRAMCGRKTEDGKL